jgi:hypothetical protein
MKIQKLSIIINPQHGGEGVIIRIPTWGIFFSFKTSQISDGHLQHQGRRWHCQASGYIAELFLGTGCNRDKAGRECRPTLTWSEGSIPTPRQSSLGRWVRFHDWTTPPYLARLGDSAIIKKLLTKSINLVQNNTVRCTIPSTWKSLHWHTKKKGTCVFTKTSDLASFSSTFAIVTHVSQALVISFCFCSRFLNNESWQLIEWRRGIAIYSRTC